MGLQTQTLHTYYLLTHATLGYKTVEDFWHTVSETVQEVQFTNDTT